SAPPGNAGGTPTRAGSIGGSRRRMPASNSGISTHNISRGGLVVDDHSLFGSLPPSSFGRDPCDSRRSATMISTPNLYPVHLTSEQRQSLEDIPRNGPAPARKIQHANVLLMSDRDRPAGRMAGTEVAAALGMHINTVNRIRKRFVLEGERPA